MHASHVHLRGTRVAAVALVTFAMLLANALPAHANYLATGWQFTHRTSEWCVKNYVELSHSGEFSGGTHQSAVESWYKADTPFGGYDCFAKFKTPKKLRVRAWFWNGDKWHVCVDTRAVITPADFRNRITLQFPVAPCGPGLYTTDGMGKAWMNSRWVGGWLPLWDWSTVWHHDLPAS